MSKAKTALSRAGAFVGKDPLLLVSLVAALVTSLFHAPRFAAIDWKVLVCLFSLMVAMKGLEACGVMEAVSASLLRRCRSERGVLFTLSLLSFFSSMLLTNDVAILTLLPILFAMGRACGMDVLLPAIFITVAANLGSMATPFGNPQNLFLFTYYQPGVGRFFAMSLPFAGICLCAVVLSVLVLKRPRPIRLQPQRILPTGGKSVAAFSAAAVVVVLCVLGVLPYLVCLPVTLVVAFLCNRGVLLQADYRLLLTFLFLFIAIDNLASFAWMQETVTAFTQTPRSTYLPAALLSQVISNVPCAVLLAPFTGQLQALLWGVSVGGLGTLVASMANLIAFRLFTGAYPGRGRTFLLRFSLFNVVLLLLLGVLFYFLLPAA